MSEPTRHPLCWPDHYPRTLAADRESSAKFGSTTFARAVKQLAEEVERHADDDDSPIIISTEVPVRLDGLPYASRRPISDDPGVAVYWTAWGKPMALACDIYNTLLGNLRGCCLTLEAMRAIERHGGRQIVERAFRGFQALPSAIVTERPWYDVLGYSAPPAEFEVARARYRELIQRHHPDRGGDEDKARSINVAWDAAMKHYGKA